MSCGPSARPRSAPGGIGEPVDDRREVAAVDGDGLVVAEDELLAGRRGGLGDDVDRRRLDLGQEHVGLARARGDRGGERRPVAPGRSRARSPVGAVHLFEVTREQAGALGRGRREERHAAAGDGLDRSRPEDGRNDGRPPGSLRRRRRAGTRRARRRQKGGSHMVRKSASEMSIRYVPRYPVMYSGGCAAPSHADDRLRLHRRHHRATALPDHHGRRHAPRPGPAPAPTFAHRGPPPCRRRSAGSRPSSPRRAPRPRSSRTPRAAPALEAASRPWRAEPLAARRRPAGRPVPHAPSPRSPRARARTDRRAGAPMTPLTAVFPTRLPVPMIASDGLLESRARGWGENSKSAPT